MIVSRPIISSLFRNTLSAIISILLLLIVFSNQAYSQEYQFSSSSKKAIKHYNIAVDNYTNSNNGGALMSLDKSVSIDPEFIEAWMLMGDIYTDINSYNKAVSAYESALSIDPDFFPPVYYFLGNIYYQMGKYSLASKSLNKLLTFETISPEVRILAAEKLIFSDASVELVNNPVDTNPINLGTPVNSNNDEYINYVNTDFNRLLLTIRSEKPSRQSSMRFKEELYNTNLVDSAWSKPELVNLPWRDESLNMGTINFSADGKTMYFTGCYWPIGYGGCDIYSSESSGAEWLLPYNMGSVLNTSNWESQPVISSDSKKLFFASKRPGGKGGSDIWMSIKLKNNQWSPPINLGDSINTPKDEMAPFLHADGNTLFFASTGHPGLGGYDLFISRLDELGRWSEATNIGYPTNSKYNEIVIFSSIDGKRSWISSDRAGGYGKYDIYYFDNYAKIQPKKLMYVEGLVLDSETGKPLKSRIEITNLSTAESINTTFSDSITGNFLIVLFPGVDYAFNVSKKGYLFHSENINLRDTIGLESVKRTFELSPFKSGSHLVMNNVFFEFNKHTLLSSSYIELNKLAKAINENPNFIIEISGHTDNVGSYDYNMELSEKRAEAVGLYLIGKGINSNRLIYTSKGSTEPVATNDTEVGRALNRRTEILVR